MGGCGAGGSLFAAMLLGLGGSVAAQVEGDAGIVADAVRQRGHPCADPVSAVPDPEASAPDERAWILSCRDASYRVRFVGSARDTQVEPLAR
jgi:hypothetical protein